MRETPVLSSFFSSDGPFSLQFAIIFAIIFLVLAAGVLVMRRLTGQGASLSSKASPRGRQPRLGIVDIYELDRQRQLILLRRDNVEHLLLVGGPNDVVVERNITRGINARMATEEPAYDEPAEPVPEASPALPHRAAPDMSFPPEPVPQASPAMAYREPSFEMPVVVPAPVPGSAAPPHPVARPLDPPSRPEFADAFRPTPPAEAPQRRESPFARVIRRAPPSLVNLVPAALAERVMLTESQPAPAQIPEPRSQDAQVQDAQVQEAWNQEQAAPPVVAPPAVRAIDAAILSDMARQLEEALRRPSAAVRPAAPAQAERVREPEPVFAPAPEPSSFEPADISPAPPAPAPQPVDPIAAAMAATAESAGAPEPTEPEIEHTLFSQDPPAREPPAQEAPTKVAPVDQSPAPEPVAPEPFRTEPVFVEPPSPEPVAEVPPAPEPSPHEEPVIHAAVVDAPLVEEPAPPAPPAPKQAASPNPFSVEEIEAEFARLLGRPLDRKL